MNAKEKVWFWSAIAIGFLACLTHPCGPAKADQRSEQSKSMQVDVNRISVNGVVRDSVETILAKECSRKVTKKQREEIAQIIRNESHAQIHARNGNPRTDERTVATIVASLLVRESRCLNIRERGGASIGLMQIHPGGSGRGVHLRELFERQENVRIGIRHLLKLHRQCGEWEGAVSRYRGNYSCISTKGSREVMRIVEKYGEDNI